jgi:hypothetical protein
MLNPNLETESVDPEIDQLTTAFIEAAWAKDSIVIANAALRVLVAALMALEEEHRDSMVALLPAAVAMAMADFPQQQRAN